MEVISQFLNNLIPNISLAPEFDSPIGTVAVILLICVYFIISPFYFLIENFGIVGWLIILIPINFWIGTLIHFTVNWKRFQTQSKRVFWLLTLIFLNWIGALVYLFIVVIRKRY